MNEIYSPFNAEAEAPPPRVPAPFPFWPFAVCVGFPYVVALAAWLVHPLTKG